MFNIEKFSEVLQKISDSYHSISDFSETSEVNRTYLSKYINKKLNAPPSPKVLMNGYNFSGWQTESGREIDTETTIISEDLDSNPRWSN